MQFTPPNSALADWKLRDLSVYHDRIRLSGLDDPHRMGVSDIIEADCMRRLTSLVPSIQMLKGLPRNHRYEREEVASKIRIPIRTHRRDFFSWPLSQH